MLYQYVWRNWSYFSDRNVKFVRGWPIFGSTYSTVLGWESGATAYQAAYQAFPDEKFIGIYEMPGKPAYLIRDPDLVKKVTISDFDHFVNHQFKLEQDIDPLIDRSLFFIHDERWRQMRSTMSPNFTGSRMRAMHELIARYTEEFVATLKDVNANDQSHIYESKKLIAQYASDIIATTAFGIEMNTLKDPDNEFFKVGTEIANFDFWAGLKFMGCLNFPALMRVLKVKLMSEKNTNFLRHVVNDNIEQRKKNNIVRNDFIDLMIKARDDSQTTQDDADDINIGFSTVEESTMKQQSATKSKLGKCSNHVMFLRLCDVWLILSSFVRWFLLTELTSDDIVAQCVIFFIAGFDTISSTVAFMFHELALHPDIQTKIINEIETVKKELNGERLNYGSLPKLKYMDMFMSETMRRWSPTPFNDRLCSKAYVMENSDGTKVQVNPGETIIIPAYALQMDEKYFKNAEKFDPERFSDANKSSVHPGTYMPFGLGPRKFLYALCNYRLWIH